MPDEVVSRQTKTLRKGKVLVDWGQNDHSKSMVCAYSLRGKERPTVSMPVAWEELDDPAGSRSSGTTRSSASSATATSSRRC